MRKVMTVVAVLMNQLPGVGVAEVGAGRGPDQHRDKGNRKGPGIAYPSRSPGRGLAEPRTEFGEAPMPPDKEMGIWRDVHITTTGPIALRYPAVLTKINLPSKDRAMLTVRAELTNAADHPVEAVVKGHIENLAFEQPIRLGPKETQVVHFTPQNFPQLAIANPRLWWPVQLGKQDLTHSTFRSRCRDRSPIQRIRTSACAKLLRVLTRKVTASFKSTAKTFSSEELVTASICCCDPRPKGSRPSSTTCAISTSTPCDWRANWRTTTSSTSPTRWEFS